VTDARHVVVVWCLPGMDQARIVVEDDREGNLASRWLDLTQLEGVRDAIDEAIRRVRDTGG
jgi:hypothetical protein